MPPEWGNGHVRRTPFVVQAKRTRPYRPKPARLGMPRQAGYASCCLGVHPACLGADPACLDLHPAGMDAPGMHHEVHARRMTCVLRWGKSHLKRWGRHWQSILAGASTQTWCSLLTAQHIK